MWKIMFFSFLCNKNQCGEVVFAYVNIFKNLSSSGDGEGETRR